MIFATTTLKNTDYFDELLARIRAIRFDTILVKTQAKQDCRHANHHQP